MASDLEKCKQENESLREETADMHKKYEELDAECLEKGELMAKQLSEQDTKEVEIRETMDSQIDKQAESLRAQITQFQEQTKAKLKEEQELVTLLREYKTRYQEFSQSSKNSAKTKKVMQKEVGNLDRRSAQMKNDHKEVMRRLGCCDPDLVGEAITRVREEFAQKEAAWEEEK